MTSPDPCHFVIFGATGHLSSTQLLPALYQLEAAGRLGESLRFVAFARRDWSRDDWARHLVELLEAHFGEACDRAACGRFVRRFDYVGGDLREAQAYTRVMEAINKPRAGTCENIVFYLAIPPDRFAEVVVNLNGAGINRQRGRHRIVIEKPFGQDIGSARRLNKLLHAYFDEAQIYRIDHYLGKETVQNLFVFRFANMLVEPIWHRNYIDHVQITVAEESGIDGRAGYYDGVGALRDMVQNHLLQLLTAVAMEPPARFEADALRDEKVKVLRSVRPITPEEVEAHAVRGQYAAGDVYGDTVPGYVDEPGVAPASATETFAALRLYVDNWRWRDVPFCLRTGKRLARKTSLIAIRFRHPPQLLFSDACGEPTDANWMVLSIQPDEGLYVEINAKQPGLGINARTLRLEATYRRDGGPSVEAYQTLLLDAIEGDRSLFLRFDEVEWAWRAIDPVLKYWTEQRDAVHRYAAGSWGPEAADRLLMGDDRVWRNRV